MTIPKPRVAPLLLFLLGLFLVYVSLSAVHAIGVAHADTPALSAGSGSDIPAVTAPIVRGEVLDPIAVAQSGTEAAWGSIESYGPFWGGALLLFGGLGALLRRNAANHWLAQGKTLAAITTGTMLLAAVLTWRFHGGDTAGLLMSVFLAIKMLVSPTVTPVPSAAVADGAPGPNGTLGAAAVLLFVLGLGVVTTSACHPQPGSTTMTAERIALKCTAPELAVWVDALKPLMDSGVIAAATYDGSALDTAKLDALTTKASLETEVGRAVACAALESLAAWLTPQSASATMAAGLTIQPAAARIGIDRLRSRLGAAAIETSHGAL